MINRQKIIQSDHPLFYQLKKIHRRIHTFSLPAPRFLTLPFLRAFLLFRWAYHFFLRVVICEPLFKAYCKRYGKRVRTGIFLHWIQGKGDILLGDDVLLDGKISITFAARYSESPTLSIGDGTGIGHGCSLTIGKRISIGRNCRIAGEVFILDSSGHPTDPEARLAGLPPSDEEVRPVHIGDNVWIGRRAVVFPGVTIGEGSVVSAASVVMSDVPAYTVVAGNPARKIMSLNDTRPPLKTD
jgi:acetyltransferase-like isoleucine patch superfamily enzyme